MQNIKITDYFPTDVTENFDFSYVENPKSGEVTQGIDSKTRTITWEIPTLEYNQVATLRYKLKLKDKYNENILEKEIATNEKVALEYEIEDKHTTILETSPKIRLSKNVVSEQKQEEKIESKDDSISPDTLAKAGERRAVLILGVIGVAVIAIAAYKKYKKIKY